VSKDVTVTAELAGRRYGDTLVDGPVTGETALAGGAATIAHVNALKPAAARRKFVGAPFEDGRGTIGPGSPNPVLRHRRQARTREPSMAASELRVNIVR
jgi:hypothetical protein